VSTESWGGFIAVLVWLFGWLGLLKFIGYLWGVLIVLFAWFWIMSLRIRATRATLGRLPAARSAGSRRATRGCNEWRSGPASTTKQRRLDSWPLSSP
jgi:hypothetical protein